MMKRTRFAIMFYIKRTKLTAQGTCPIYVRVSVNSERIEFSMNESIYPDSWNSKIQRAMVQDQNGVTWLYKSRVKTVDKLLKEDM
jgi:hypothetical protein